jgi:hypothetical protein
VYSIAWCRNFVIPFLSNSSESLWLSIKIGWIRPSLLIWYKFTDINESKMNVTYHISLPLICSFRLVDISMLLNIIWFDTLTHSYLISVISYDLHNKLFLCWKLNEVSTQLSFVLLKVTQQITKNQLYAK